MVNPGLHDNSNQSNNFPDIFLDIFNMGKEDSIKPMTYFPIDVYARFVLRFDVVNKDYKMIIIIVSDVNFDNDCWVFRKFWGHLEKFEYLEALVSRKSVVLEKEVERT